MNKKHIRLIFGLKIRQLRQEQGLSFKNLAQSSGMSISYLNEIEKGKKYPKSDKILDLAKALNVPYDYLVSLKMSKKLAPIADLLNSNILENIPLSMFGLESHTLIALISQAPAKINAFISTLLKMARNYEMNQYHFYFAALRSYQEMHENYFEELEDEASSFIQSYHLKDYPPPSQQDFLDILKGSYGYKIEHEYLDTQVDLQHFRSVFVLENKTLYINKKLSAHQQSFLLAKEIAFNYLKLQERPYTASMFQVKSFEEVLNNFKASYFSVALLVNRESLIKDLARIFQMENWNSKDFLAMMNKYAATPEMFLHRLTNLLPRYFELDNLFFFRMNDQLEYPSPLYSITKELHLSRLHAPHKNGLREHYCRRWKATKILQSLRENPLVSNEVPLVEIQRLSYVGTRNKYLCISLAKNSISSPQTNVSVTLGIAINKKSKKKIGFINHPDIPSGQVGVTCERCPLRDCADRAAPATLSKNQQQLKQIQQALTALRPNPIKTVS